MSQTPVLFWSFGLYKQLAFLVEILSVLLHLVAGTKQTLLWAENRHLLPSRPQKFEIFISRTSPSPLTMAGDETTTPPAAFHEPAPLPAFTAFPDQAAPAAPDSAPPKVRDPEKYQGERNIITLGNWLFAVGRYMAFTGMEPSRQVLYASTLMRGEAMLWFHSNYENIDPSLLRWSDVAARLRSYFAPPNQDRRLNDEWALLRQETTVYDYDSKLQALAMQMPTLTEAAKLDNFIRGLKPKTRIEVELRDPQTTDDAYRLSDRFDRIVYAK
jgi:Ty3 transposon capsid-like protein